MKTLMTCHGYQNRKKVLDPEQWHNIFWGENRTKEIEQTKSNANPAAARTWNAAEPGGSRSSCKAAVTDAVGIALMSICSSIHLFLPSVKYKTIKSLSSLIENVISFKYSIRIWFNCERSISFKQMQLLLNKCTNNLWHVFNFFTDNFILVHSGALNCTKKDSSYIHTLRTYNPWLQMSPLQSLSCALKHRSHKYRLIPCSLFKNVERNLLARQTVIGHYLEFEGFLFLTDSLTSYPVSENFACRTRSSLDAFFIFWLPPPEHKLHSTVSSTQYLQVFSYPLPSSLNSHTVSLPSFALFLIHYACIFPRLLPLKGVVVRCSCMIYSTSV